MSSTPLLFRDCFFLDDFMVCGGRGRAIKFYLAGIYPEVEKIRQLMNVGIKENGGREPNQCLVQESITTGLRAHFI